MVGIVGAGVIFEWSGGGGNDGSGRSSSSSMAIFIV